MAQVSLLDSNSVGYISVCTNSLYQENADCELIGRWTGVMAFSKEVLITGKVYLNGAGVKCLDQLQRRPSNLLIIRSYCVTEYFYNTCTDR